MRLTRLNGVLAGVLTMLCLVRCQLPVRGQEAGAGDSTPVAPCSVPIRPDFITHLGVQYLNSGVPIFTAFQTHSADLDGTGSARFRVYALTDDVRFCANVTSEFSGPVSRYSLGKLRVRLYPAAPLSNLHRRFRLVGEGSNAYVEYSPVIRWGPRTDALRFSFSTRRPRSTFLAHFDLNVPGAVTALPSP